MNLVEQPAPQGEQRAPAPGEEHEQIQVQNEGQEQCTGGHERPHGVDQRGGAACHTGKRSCFYRRLDDGSWTDVGQQVFDPEEVYKK